MPDNSKPEKAAKITTGTPGKMIIAVIVPVNQSL